MEIKKIKIWSFEPDGVGNCLISSFDTSGTVFIFDKGYGIGYLIHLLSQFLSILFRKGSFVDIIKYLILLAEETGHP